MTRSQVQIQSLEFFDLVYKKNSDHTRESSKFHSIVHSIKWDIFMKCLLNVTILLLFKPYLFTCSFINHQVHLTEVINYLNVGNLL